MRYQCIMVYTTDTANAISFITNSSYYHICDLVPRIHLPNSLLTYYTFRGFIIEMANHVHDLDDMSTVVPLGLKLWSNAKKEEWLTNFIQPIVDQLFVRYSPNVEVRVNDHVIIAPARLAGTVLQIVIGMYLL